MKILMNLRRGKKERKKERKDDDDDDDDGRKVKLVMERSKFVFTS